MLIAWRSGRTALGPLIRTNDHIFEYLDDDSNLTAASQISCVVSFFKFFEPRQSFAAGQNFHQNKVGFALKRLGHASHFETRPKDSYQLIL